MDELECEWIFEDNSKFRCRRLKCIDRKFIVFVRFTCYIKCVCTRNEEGRISWFDVPCNLETLCRFEPIVDRDNVGMLAFCFSYNIEGLCGCRRSCLSIEVVEECTTIGKGEEKSAFMLGLFDVWLIRSCCHCKRRVKYLILCGLVR